MLYVFHFFRINSTRNKVWYFARLNQALIIFYSLRNRKTSSWFHYGIQSHIQVYHNFSSEGIQRHSIIKYATGYATRISTSFVHQHQNGGEPKMERRFTYSNMQQKQIIDIYTCNFPHVTSLATHYSSKHPEGVHIWQHFDWCFPSAPSWALMQLVKTQKNLWRSRPRVNSIHQAHHHWCMISGPLKTRFFSAGIGLQPLQ